MNPGAGLALLERIVTYVIDPSVKVIFTLGLFMFFWGIVEFLFALREGKPSEPGKQHMIWGLVGMLIMVSVYGIIALIMNTLEIDFSDATDVGRIDNVNPGINFFGQ